MILPKKYLIAGFTLIELLVAISILAVVTTTVITVINIPVWMGRSRDSVRLEDLAVLSGSLERYYADNNSYISSSTYMSASTVLAPLTKDGTYIKSIPQDPQDVNYYYYSTGQDFCLCASMEQIKGEASDLVPASCKTPQFIPADGKIAYCVENTF